MFCFTKVCQIRYIVSSVLYHTSVMRQRKYFAQRFFSKCTTALSVQAIFIQIIQQVLPYERGNKFHCIIKGDCVSVVLEIKLWYRSCSALRYQAINTPFFQNSRPKRQSKALPLARAEIEKDRKSRRDQRAIILLEIKA